MKKQKTYTLAEARKMLEKKNPNSVIQAKKEVEVLSELGEDIVIFVDTNPDTGKWRTKMIYAPFEDGIGGIIKIQQHSNFNGVHQLNYVKFSTAKTFGSTKGFCEKLVKPKDWKAYIPKPKA